MTILLPRATFGLNCKATPTKAGTSGTVQIGKSNNTVNLNANRCISFEAVIVGTSSDLVIDVSDLDNTGSTAWTAGTAQVETATAAGTISGSGNASVVVTSAGMTGSPITLSVPVLATDDATAWATKVRAAMNANAVIAARFTVGGSTAGISLTRKPTSTYTVNGASVPVYPANDATLNISLDNGTCTGITTAATSANTTAGVATAGAYAPDLDGNDFEGESGVGLAEVSGVYVENYLMSNSHVLITQSTILQAYPLPPGGAIQVADALDNLPTSDMTIEPSSAGDNSLLVTVTIAGR